METMIYLCRAERQGRMIAVAIRPESLYKNECPIEGHPFLPNDKPGILPIHLVGKCERKQGATEKVSYLSVWIENKCSPFQYDFKKLSIVPANETKKRLLKSGKDRIQKFVPDSKKIHFRTLLVSDFGKSVRKRTLLFLGFSSFSTTYTSGMVFAV